MLIAITACVSILWVAALGIYLSPAYSRVDARKE